MSSQGTFHAAILGSMLLYLLAAKADRPPYMTAYACEGNLLTIQCYDKQSINLVRAIYGRFSITVCNEHGVGDWSVNCMSTRSFRILQERCNQKNSCSIRASSQTFGDPCPGTRKYLEAHYLCVSESTTPSSTYSKAIPSWLITRPTLSPDWLVPETSSTDGNAIKSGVEKLNSPSTSPSSVLLQPLDSSTLSSTPKEMPTFIKEEVTSSIWQSTLTPKVDFPSSSTETATSSKPTKNLKRDYCPPTRMRGVQWDWTKKGEMATIACPGGASGYAKWHCGTNPVKWIPDNPDLSGCKSAWVSDLKEKLDQNEPVLKIASELARKTATKPLYGGDVITMTTMLKKKATKMANSLSATHERSKEEMVKELMQSVIETSSNLLSSRQRVTWNDLSRQEQMKAATSLLVGLEDNAYLLADQVNYEKVLVQADRNVMMTIKVYKVENLKDIHFPTNEDLNNVNWDLATDSISLSAQALRDKTENGLVKIIFFTFRNLEELLQPFDGGYFSQNLTPILNTRVISAMVARHRNTILQRPITITLRHLHEFNNSRPVPVFWDYDTDSWSEEGCKVIRTNRTHTVFSCDHLTNFAVVTLDAEEESMPHLSTFSLGLVTNFGCIVSIICLSLSLVTFVLLGGLQSDRNTIHKNLCVSLLLSEVVFLLGIGQTNKRILCGVVAGVLHFSFLCVFAWTFLEGFQLYMTLIEIFDPDKSRVRWYYVLGYGLPSLIVCASSIIDPSSYGTHHYCWLRADNYFVFSFVGPVIAVVVINLLFLNVAIYMMCRHATISTALKNKEVSYLANIRSWVWAAVILVCLLGLTWTFCLLFLNKQSAVMAYTFAVFNGLQGIFIFVFYCIQNEMVQQECKRVFCVHRSMSDISKADEQEQESKFCMTSLGKVAIPDSNLNSDVPNNMLTRIQEPGNGKNGSITRIVTLPGKANTSHMLLEPEGEVASSKSSNKDSGHGGSDHEDSCPNNQLVDSSLELTRPIIDLPGADYPAFLVDYYEGKLKDKHKKGREHDSYMSGRLCVSSDVIHPFYQTQEHIYMDVDNQDESVSEPVYDEIEQPLQGPNVNQSQRTDKNGQIHCDKNKMETFKDANRRQRLFT